MLTQTPRRTDEWKSTSTLTVQMKRFRNVYKIVLKQDPYSLSPDLDVFPQIWTFFARSGRLSPDLDVFRKEVALSRYFSTNVHFVLFLKIQSLSPYPLLTKSILKWKFPSSTNLDGLKLLPLPVIKCHDLDLWIRNPASFLGIPNLNFFPETNHSGLCFRFSAPTPRKMLSSALHTPRLVPYTFQTISYSKLGL